MIFELLRKNVDVSDDEFDAIYPPDIKELGRRQWATVAVARTAANYLVSENCKNVLDIGSGAGKFCFVGAAITLGHFTGHVHYENVISMLRQLSTEHNVKNIDFIHGSVTAINFASYQSFFYCNPPNTILNPEDELDINAEGIDSEFVAQQLRGCPIATRLATMSTPINRIPSCFQLVDSLLGGHLRLWHKIQ